MKLLHNDLLAVHDVNAFLSGIVHLCTSDGVDILICILSSLNCVDACGLLENEAFHISGAVEISLVTWDNHAFLYAIETYNVGTILHLRSHSVCGVTSHWDSLIRSTHEEVAHRCVFLTVVGIQEVRTSLTLEDQRSASSWFCNFCHLYETIFNTGTNIC